MNIYLIIGAPGSGKSSYCEKEFCGLDIISCDQLRESIFGEKRSFEIRCTIKRIIKEIVMAKVIASKKDIVIDSTYFNEAHERKFFFELGKDITIHAIFLNTTLEHCLKQNKIRAHNRIVPESMVEMLFDRVCPPSDSEGFKSIKIVNEKNR